MAKKKVVVKEMPKTKFYPIYKGDSDNIVEVFGAIGIEPNEVQLVANKNGFPNYLNTKGQNSWLIDRAKGGNLLRM